MAAAKKTSKKDDKETPKVETPETKFEKAKEILTKSYGVGKVFSMASKQFINHSIVRSSYGELGVDAILFGGAPQGRIIKIAGKFSSGKSTLIASYVAIKTRILKQRVCLIDYEYAWTREWLVSLGADINYITVGYPETLEEAFDMLELMYLTGYFTDVIFESLSSSSPEDEVEADNDEWTQGLKARLANKFFRKMESHQNSFVGKGILPPTFQFTGHLFKNLHDRFRPEGTSGGNGQDNSSTVILHLAQNKKITVDDGSAKDEEDKEEKEVFGFKVRAKTEKNKLAPPFKTCVYGILHEEFRGHAKHGFFHADTVIRVAERMGIVTKSGSWYTVPGWDKTVQGLAATQEKLIRDRDTFECVVEAIKSEISRSTADEDNPNGVILGFESRYAYLCDIARTDRRPQKVDSATEGGELAGGGVLSKAELVEKKKQRAKKGGKK